MSDLVERLRRSYGDALYREAADRIEQLEAALRKLEMLAGSHTVVRRWPDEPITQDGGFEHLWDIARRALAGESDE